MTSENGTPYSSTLLATIAVILKIKQSLAPEYHPQSNGNAERFMGTLRNMIVSYTNEVADHSKWDEDLGLFQLAYNSSQHSQTGFTPFYLVFGRDPRVPATVALTPAALNPDHYQSSLKYNIDAAHKIVQSYQ